MWGIFETDNDDTVHVAPLDKEKDWMKQPHIPSANCQCRPWYDDRRASQGTRPLLIHEEIQ